MSVAKEHLDWFAGLKPGDEMAVRSHGEWSSGPWHREVVTRRTSTTVAWSGGYRGAPVYSATVRTRTYDLRPVTDEDRAQWRAEEEELEVWRWIGQLRRPLAPDVRAILLRAKREVSGE